MPQCTRTMSIQSDCKGRRREKKRDYFESRTGSEKKEMVLGVEPILSREQAGADMPSISTCLYLKIRMGRLVWPVGFFL